MTWVRRGTATPAATPPGMLPLTLDRLTRLDPVGNPHVRRETPAERAEGMYELGAALGLDRNAVDVGRARRGLTVLQQRAQFARRLRTREAGILRRDEAALAEVRAEQARVLHAARQAQQLASLRRVREEQALGQRLDNVLRAFGLASVAPTAELSLAKVSTGQVGESKPPPPVDLPPIVGRLNLIAFQVEALELELDAAEGRAEATLLTSDQKNWLILTRFVGVHARDLSRAIPELGSPRTIERVRANAGQRPSVGGEPRRRQRGEEAAA